jgi:hypothetical protein
MMPDPKNSSKLLPEQVALNVNRLCEERKRRGNLGCVRKDWIASLCSQ